jgi:hypothetical protein
VSGWLSQLGLFDALLPSPNAPSVAKSANASPAPLPLGAPAVPATPEAFHEHLQRLGLRGIERLVLTRNRSVVVSVKVGVLRAHEGFVAAPPHVHQAIVRFVMARTRAARQEAIEVLVKHPLPLREAVRRPERTHPDDEPLRLLMADWHGRFNAQHFGGQLEAIPVHVSRRIARRLGHYTPKAAEAQGLERSIAISRKHLRRDGLAAALETLLHEMVHQWQDETGRPVDHGPAFRRKAKDVGITPRAVRVVG